MKVDIVKNSMLTRDRYGKRRLRSLAGRACDIRDGRFSLEGREVRQAVNETGFDFTTLRTIGAKADWMAAQPWLRCTDNWYDQNFVLRGKAGEFKLAVGAIYPQFGIPLFGRVLI